MFLLNREQDTHTHTHTHTRIRTDTHARTKSAHMNMTVYLFDPLFVEVTDVIPSNKCRIEIICNSLFLGKIVNVLTRFVREKLCCSVLVSFAMNHSLFRLREAQSNFFSCRRKQTELRVVCLVWRLTLNDLVTSFFVFATSSVLLRVGQLAEIDGDQFGVLQT